MTDSIQVLIVYNSTEAGMLAYQLLKKSSYELHLAASCEEAGKILLSQHIDLVLLGSPRHEHCLPPLDHLLETGKQGVAVIALLDSNEKERYLACHKQGALDCLMAPFSPEQLIKSIERCLAIKSLERDKRDFLSMLSHDLKNPITAAIGSIDLVREKRLGSINREQASYLLSAIESCNEVVAMIDNLLDIQRFEAGKMVFHKRPVNLSDLTQQVLNGFKGVFKHAQINLNTSLEENLPLICLDKNKFSRVIANLLTNAVKFTPVGGEISVFCCCGVSEESKLIQILKIKDNGEGITATDLPNIFNRFIQARNQPGRGNGGAGLGLSFCKIAVEAHQGTITAESREGVGSEFTITLPISEH